MLASRKLLSLQQLILTKQFLFIPFNYVTQMIFTFCVRGKLIFAVVWVKKILSHFYDNWKTMRSGRLPENGNSFSQGKSTTFRDQKNKLVLNFTISLKYKRMKISLDTISHSRDIYDDIIRPKINQL